MTSTIKYLFISAIIATAGCQSPAPETKPASKEAVSRTEETDNIPASGNETKMKLIDEKRSSIEALPVEPVLLPTTGMREKIRQKWSRIGFYVQNGSVIRIKTFPHENISKRTEEFYADSTGLILALSNDRGEEPAGNPKTENSKLYYFEKGMPIGEFKGANESEYTVKNSDAEELLSEYLEYLEIYKQQKK